MEIAIVKSLAYFLYPPTSNVILIFAGLLLRRRWRRIGSGLTVLGAVTLLIASSGLFTGFVGPLFEPVGPQTAQQFANSNAEAIVVLGGGRVRALEYGDETVSMKTLLRLRFGASLHRATGLPILVSGGSVSGEPRSEAELMREALVQEFGVPVRWIEGQSRNTEANARYSAKLLKEAGLGHIILVSQAVHLRRAVEMFEAQGLEVTPAGTDFNGGLPEISLKIVAPSSWALEDSQALTHEWLGILWYRMRN
ncbi:MAG: YdcF family protein [Pseudomonadota bacterium]